MFLIFKFLFLCLFLFFNLNFGVEVGGGIDITDVTSLCKPCEFVLVVFIIS